MSGLAPAAFSTLAVAMLACWLRAAIERERRSAVLETQRQRWRGVLKLAVSEGRVDEAFGSRRLLAASLLAGAFAGFSLGGPVGLAIGATAAPLVVRSLIRGRRRRYGAQVDACAAELAQALASSLAGGRSIRGAILGAPSTVGEPLANELERTSIDLTLGTELKAALASLCVRTRSSRLEALCGAIELQRGSGGDLVKMMRELADAFRERDRALRDAKTASAQARFTAYVVAAIPVTVLAALELASPGAVSGALSLLPTALMLAIALALLGSGALLAQRIGSVDR